ncbi:ergothioneine biosynthesis protein EgtB [Aphanothece hegewaldii CCALA 016]|uniref:Ergothioneine biosynthesis protein EgtB n=1 Tax=Aphanothece hegewaldii CCALA 016 TaxID=2107694 RepID=A0A2T1LXM4_9CHRO|nr:SUMF1/EgtB/PvdO family nonheme iron enzyme [Aphanothece hegewaldii]PSF37137.1 ergothioneine biosynthesis protein EgtB [Aphanothece hegewaldii CCALA 016]
MTLASVQLLKELLFNDLQICRDRTLNLLAIIPSDLFSQQIHPDFSPMGWHFAHIAYTEAFWILEKFATLPALFPEYRRLFAADGLPKTERQKLPSIEFITEYLDLVRSKVLFYLEIAPLEKQERFWRWLIQHESQHNETICYILQLTNPTGNLAKKEQKKNPSKNFGEMVEIPSGEFIIGNDGIEAQDNERPSYLIELDTYWIDIYPVTCGEYREFMETGGYQKSEFWSPGGWQWKEKQAISQPLYWIDTHHRDDHPVYGVSWYEAQAYANFVGKRLPTEMEWEKAASWNSQTQQKYIYPWGDIQLDQTRCNFDRLIGHTTPVNTYPQGQSFYGCYDMLGNVWEWTDSWFKGYSDFTPYPYQGYSQVYFDNQHRVLRGGSWVTYPWILRNSFRNWYYPTVREIFAGFRCAR